MGQRRRVLAAAAAASLGVLAIRSIPDGHDTVVTSRDPRIHTDWAHERPDMPDVVPNSDLVDGQVVEVSGAFDPSAVVGVGLCTTADDNGALRNCDINIDFAVTGDGDAKRLAVTVVRAIETADGLIDCAGERARCLIGMRTSRDLFAPISFRSDLAPLSVTRIEVDNEVVADGEVVRLRGAGFAANAEVYVRQCRAGAPDPGRASAPCDQARILRTLADAEGTFEVPYRVFAEGLDYDGWFGCEPCVLTAGSFRHHSASETVAVRLFDEPIRPAVAITPDGPHKPSQRVDLRGAGFQALIDDFEIAWCQFSTAGPEHARQGEAHEGGTRCVYPEEGFTARTDELGSFVLDDYPMPDEDFASACDGEHVRCALSWYPGDGSLPAFITLLELT